MCLPHAGGPASFFFPVSKALTPEVEVLAVQYPGRQERRHEPNIDNVPDLADQIFDALRHPFGGNAIRLQLIMWQEREPSDSWLRYGSRT